MRWSGPSGTACWSVCQRSAGLVRRRGRSAVGRSNAVRSVGVLGAFERGLELKGQGRRRGHVAVIVITRVHRIGGQLPERRTRADLVEVHRDPTSTIHFAIGSRGAGREGGVSTRPSDGGEAAVTGNARRG